MAQQAGVPGPGAIGRVGGQIPPGLEGVFGPSQGPQARLGPPPGGPMQAAPGAVSDADVWKTGTYMKDPAAQAALQEAVRARYNLTPGMGMGTPAYDAEANLAAEQRRRMARGLSIADRMRGLERIGVPTTGGMRELAGRMTATPQQAFMLSRGGR